jgi:hypothetical protein
MPIYGPAAQVRWRAGRFLRLNDLAYSHRGEIVVKVVQRWLAQSGGANVRTRSRMLR